MTTTTTALSIAKTITALEQALMAAKMVEALEEHLDRYHGEPGKLTDHLTSRSHGLVHLPDADGLDAAHEAAHADGLTVQRVEMVAALAVLLGPRA
jgi:hypothetical protein